MADLPLGKYSTVFRLIFETRQHAGSSLVKNISRCHTPLKLILTIHVRHVLNKFLIYEKLSDDAGSEGTRVLLALYSLLWNTCLSDTSTEKRLFKLSGWTEKTNGRVQIVSFLLP